MRPDRDLDWGVRLKSLSQQKAEKQRENLQILRRAAISSAHVTGDEHWNFFLSVINAKVKTLREQRDTAAESLKKSDDFSPDTLINQKLAVRLLGREIESLEWVIGLPKELQEQGDQASELLGTIDKSAD